MECYLICNSVYIGQTARSFKISFYVLEITNFWKPVDESNHIQQDQKYVSH